MLGWVSLDTAVHRLYLAGDLHNGVTAVGILSAYAARQAGSLACGRRTHQKTDGGGGSSRTRARPAMGPGAGVTERGLAAMKVGVPKEVKNHEYRVAITPAGVHELVRGGHEVFIEARRRDRLVHPG